LAGIACATCRSIRASRSAVPFAAVAASGNGSDWDRVSGAASTSTGSTKKNRAPLPSSLFTPMRPLCAVTICLQIGRPRPVPFGLFVSVSPT
jgi:hypothetical protein